MIPWQWIDSARVILEAAIGLGMEIYYALPGYRDPREGGVGIGLLLLVTAEVLARRIARP